MNKEKYIIILLILIMAVAGCKGKTMSDMNRPVTAVFFNAMPPEACTTKVGIGTT